MHLSYLRLVYFVVNWYYLYKFLSALVYFEKLDYECICRDRILLHRDKKIFKI